MTAQPGVQPTVIKGRTTLGKAVRNAFALAALNLKLIARDRRAFFLSLLFPMAFLFVFGSITRGGDIQEKQRITMTLVSLNIILGAFFGQGMNLVVQRERGMLRRYRLTPLGTGALLGGTVLSGLAMLSFIIALQLFLLHTVYGVPMAFSMVRFAVVALIGAVSMASLGIIVAAITSTVQEAQVVFQITFMTTVFLSGMTVPLDSFPSPLQKIAVFLPPTHMVATLEDALRNNLEFRWDAPPLFALALMAGTAFFIAGRLFRWERDDPLPRKAKFSALLSIIPILLVGLWLNTQPKRPVVFHVPPPPAHRMPPPAHRMPPPSR